MNSKITPDVVDVIVKRSLWGSGNKIINDEGLPRKSFLYNPITKLSCCLGIALQSQGMSKQKMSGVGRPEAVLNSIPANLQKLTANEFTTVVWFLMQLNDALISWCLYNPITTLGSNIDKDFILKDEAHRERLLHEYGLLVGINFTFVD